MTDAMLALIKRSADYMLARAFDARTETLSRRHARAAVNGYTAVRRYRASAAS